MDNCACTIDHTCAEHRLCEICEAEGADPCLVDHPRNLVTHCQHENPAYWLLCRSCRLALSTFGLLV